MKENKYNINQNLKNYNDKCNLGRSLCVHETMRLNMQHFVFWKNIFDLLHSATHLPSCR